MHSLSVDTSISKVSVEPQNVTALKGASVIFHCTIMLNYAIGPDHSALQVVWTSDSLLADSVAAKPTTNLANSFLDTFILQNITSSIEKYCCQANISDTMMLACSSVTVHGERITILFH